MTIALLYWLLMVLWLLSLFAPTAWGKWPNAVLLFLLFALLGWQLFGAPVHR